MNFIELTVFIRKLTVKKIFNFLKIKISYYLSVICRKPFRWGIPWSISIEPTDYCNLKCPQCPVGLGLLTRDKGFIDFKMFKKTIDILQPYLLNLFIYFQGEPLLHPRLIDMVNYATKHNIFTAIATNAQLINYKTALSLVKAGLDKIIISLDAIDQNTYKFYRINGNIINVLQAIIYLKMAKKALNSLTPIIEVQFLVLKTNQNQIKAFKLLCKNLKANKCTLKTAQIIDFSTANLFIPSIEKFSRYKKNGKQWNIKNKLKNRCPRLWNSAVITWDGYILPCCFDKDAKYKLANVQQGFNFKTFNNENFKTFAKRVLTSRQSIDICSNCTE